MYQGYLDSRSLITLRGGGDPPFAPTLRLIRFSLSISLFGILAKHKETYKKARDKNPARWIQNKTRDWSPLAQTSLNPIDERKIEKSHKKSA